MSTFEISSGRQQGRKGCANHFIGVYTVFAAVVYLRISYAINIDNYAINIDNFYGEEEMKREIIIFTAVFFLLQLCSSLWALPTTAYEAEMAVAGWLKVDPQPLETTLGQQVRQVQTFTDDYGEPVYYIVYLEPSGFVIVSADDMVEPIIGFADDGTYDPSFENPLGALVTNDLNGRMAAVHRTFSLQAMVGEAPFTDTQKKWRYFISLADTSEGGFSLMWLQSIPDVRVAPLVQSKWGQSSYYDSNDERQACYNYYTPRLVDNEVSFVEGHEDNYPCGCVATFMAQLMRYHKYPNEPVEPSKFTIDVDGQTAERWLLHGEGPNGAYNWNDMVLEPGGGTTDKQRRAIGALCHDAGVSVNMQYTKDGSGALMLDAAEALKSTFKYGNAILGHNADVNMDSGLIGMINPNLDAECPVVFAIGDISDFDRGHAVLCDGYGYDSSQLYHHLNMGWEGWYDCWYNLPIVDCPNADLSGIVAACIYNIFTDGTGEIISGRIIDGKDKAIRDAVVTAKSGKGGGPYTAVTNSKGIYALTGLDSDSTYAITVNKLGYNFKLNEAATGTSSEGSSVSGNKWGVDFTGFSNCVTTIIGTETSDWSYPLNTDYHDSRTQVIYLASELGRSGAIIELSLDVTKAVYETMESWTIRMKHIRMSEYDADNYSLDAEGWTVVYQNNESFINEGWHKFEFQTPFEYNGRDNLLVDFSQNNSSYSESGRCRASRPGGKRSVYACSDSQHEDPLNWSRTTSPGMICGNNIPNVKLAFGRESTVICEDIKLTASDGAALNHFGSSVSISGDYVIVGAPGSVASKYHAAVYGSAYIFKLEGTSWTQQAELTPPQGYTEYSFGDSVSISGDYAIVYAQADKDTHSFFIFRREGTSWVQQAEFTYSNRQWVDYTGPSVSISRDYAIGGALSSAYIFERVGTSWGQQAVLFKPNLDRYERFGDAVSISGDYAIVATRPLFGLVCIFKREGESWTQQDELTSLDGSTENSFGSSVSIDENYAIVGAENDGGIGENSGAAYIYKRSGTTWSEQAKLIASVGTAGALFGNSVTIKGDYTIIGAKGDNENGAYSGSAYIFKREGTGWVQKTKLTAWDGGAQDYFGSSVSIDGDYAIVGAPYDNDKGANSGSAYIFKRGCVSWLK